MTHQTFLDNEDNDENNIRSDTSSYSPYGLNGDYSKMPSSSGNHVSGRSYIHGSHRTTTLNPVDDNNNEYDSHNAEKYQNILKELKEKYTLSGNVVCLSFFF
jgi:hypothetical protein